MGEVVILRRSRIMVAIPVPQRNFQPPSKPAEEDRKILITGAYKACPR